MNSTHTTAEELDRYRRRIAAPDELMAVDRHIAECDRCYAALRAGGSEALSSALEALTGGEESRHLTYETLERWVDGRAGIIEREMIDEHIDGCHLCRNELADLARVRDSIRGTPAPKNVVRWLALAAVVVMAFAGGLLYLRNGSHPEPRAVGPTARRQPPSPSPAPARIEALARPDIISSLSGDSSSLLGNAPARATFELLAPVGTVVIDTRPRLQWAALPRAGSYTITIADAQTGAIAATGSTTAATWQPPAPLARGRTYSWQVTAHRGEDAITSPRPPAPEALFRVADHEQIAAMDGWPQDDHVKRGILFAETGFLDDAERELQLARAGELLAQVRSWRAHRPSPTTTNAAQ